MVFFETIAAIMEFDIPFLIDLIMNNLFWVFGFFAAGSVFSNHKNGLAVGLFFAVLIMASTAFFTLIEFTIYTASGLLILYLVRVSLLLFLENIKGGSKFIPLGWVLSFFFVIALVAFWGI